MKLLHRGLLAAVLLGSLALVESPQALAQSSTRPMPRVVAACGTPPYTYTAGNYEFALQDVNGNICTSGSGGGGGGAVYGPTATGSPAANPPVQTGGTINGGATGNVQGFAMKAASTAPAATDPALVVAISPNGAQATSALQTTGNTSAATTATNTGTTATGIGAPADTACASDSGTCGLIAQIKRLLASLTTGNGSLATIATNSGSSVPAGTSDIGSVQLWAQPASWVSGTLTSAMTGTTDTSLIAAPGANLNNYLVTIVCGNAHATVSTGINIKDGSGGTVIGWVPAAAVYGGTAVNFNVPLKQPTANTALYVADDTTGASVKCTATGFKR